MDILPQPNDTTCGPTSLHAIYRYYGDDIPLEQVIQEVRHLKTGGTLGVYLAHHALKRGYHAIIYTYNLHIFDPTWFKYSQIGIQKKLEESLPFCKNSKQRETVQAYIDYLKMGGEIRFEDLTPMLIKKYLNRNIPILTGLLSTFLYHSPREIQVDHQLVFDDLHGEPTGHFVVLAGYDKKVLIADPYKQNPYSSDHKYEVNIHRLIGAIMLGIITYDANLLIINPKS